MADLSTIAGVPGVKSAVLSDRNGGFIDALRESDPESVSAVTAFMTDALGPIGEGLGLGPLTRLAFTGPTRAWLVVLHGQVVLSVAVEPPTAFSSVERALDAGARR